jgi:hypothetical protein
MCVHAYCIMCVWSDFMVCLVWIGRLMALLQVEIARFFEFNCKFSHLLREGEEVSCRKAGVSHSFQRFIAGPLVCVRIVLCYACGRFFSSLFGSAG